MTHSAVVRCLLPLALTPLSQPCLLTGAGDVIGVWDVSAFGGRDAEVEKVAEVDAHSHDGTALCLWVRSFPEAPERKEAWIVSAGLDGTIRGWKLSGTIYSPDRIKLSYTRDGRQPPTRDVGDEPQRVVWDNLMLNQAFTSTVVRLIANWLVVRITVHLLQTRWTTADPTPRFQDPWGAERASLGSDCLLQVKVTERTLGSEAGVYCCRWVDYVSAAGNTGTAQSHHVLKAGA
ncbi:hypothetical protein BS47DRAFT_1359195 [Hydnum rufescens UP504]|uniref:Uncharacterized protein n=1 Tax=Hydnum rufescens UP504 TaxID=1448309 RepID=A0A9P6B546_9AGAM|nr:hypothetical protein BS47DRAFT_1359195 [Hydnum rufescens UP504]